MPRTTPHLPPVDDDATGNASVRQRARLATRLGLVRMPPAALPGLSRIPRLLRGFAFIEISQYTQQTYIINILLPRNQNIYLNTLKFQQLIFSLFLFMIIEYDKFKHQKRIDYMSYLYLYCTSLKLNK